jgi:hypothetical protein
MPSSLKAKDEGNVSMKISGHHIGLLLRVAFLSAGAIFITLRATGQNNEAPPRGDAVTIEADPTVAPDPKESADNNITFPVDI